VAISGDRAIVGARADTINGDREGSAYIFERDAQGVWTEIDKLTASDGADLDFFGESVAINGDKVVVGAPGEPSNNEGGRTSGAAYIFEQDAQGVWTEVQKLTPSDADLDDKFGFSVGISGTTVVISSVLDDENGEEAGAAYIFERDAQGVWTEVKKLLASDGSVEDRFGRSVGISGDTAVVGAPIYRLNGVSGAVYMFERNAGGMDNWGEIDRLTASDGDASDQMGESVAISGNTIIAGAAFDKPAGSAYVFVKEEEPPRLDSFLCYRTQGRQDVNVSLSDEFDSGAYRGKAAKLFCAPADTEGIGIGDPATHLKFYKVSGPHIPQTNLQVTNQFGVFMFNTTKAEGLLTPSAQSLQPAPPPGLPDANSAVDAYRCLKAVTSKGAPQFPRGVKIEVED
jgi:hypothetical protein